MKCLFRTTTRLCSLQGTRQQHNNLGRPPFLSEGTWVDSSFADHVTFLFAAFPNHFGSTESEQPQTACLLKVYQELRLCKSIEASINRNGVPKYLLHENMQKKTSHVIVTSRTTRLFVSTSISD